MSENEKRVREWSQKKVGKEEGEAVTDIFIAVRNGRVFSSFS